MATKDELEQKPLFRFAKVLFSLSAFIVATLTVFVWYGVKSKDYDTSRSYFVCNSFTTQHGLTDDEKETLKVSQPPAFNAGSAAQTRINQVCYQEYSGGKDAATQANIDSFRAFQSGPDGRVYTIQGTKTSDDWHWDGLLIALAVEYLVFWFLKQAGLYIAGGRDALK